MVNHLSDGLVYPGVEELIPRILVVAGSELPNDIAGLIGKAIQILSIQDALLDSLGQFQLLVVILIEILLVLVVGRLLHKSKISEVPDVRLHHSHHHFLSGFVVELVVDEDGADQTLEDITQDLQGAYLQFRKFEGRGQPLESLVEEAEFFKSSVDVHQIHQNQVMQT